MLVGKDIYLRPIVEGDATQEYVDWLNDKAINQYLESRFVLATIQNVKKFIADTNSNSANYFFAICLNSNKKHIGNIKLGPINNYHKRGDIGLMIGDKERWGKGYATQAIGLVADFGLNELQLNKVTAGCYSNNKASEQSFLKNGFIIEGRFKNHFIDANGVWVDLISLSKLNGSNQ
ncbi:MAG: GNAT family N-acetyltransferase [Bacteroidetes bacterium]|nr:GNAT family N-acetyltransferase [Bacteroidota bacterium]MCA6442045.1 GNAT family N-acetyltransferase [Bacteroidota bacterium]